MEPAYLRGLRSSGFPRPVEGRVEGLQPEGQGVQAVPPDGSQTLTSGPQTASGPTDGWIAMLQELRLWAFLRWLKWARPKVYRRLQGYWEARWWAIVGGMFPWDSPFYLSMTKRTTEQIIQEWKIDEV
jgi:hypothetical protein